MTHLKWHNTSFGNKDNENIRHANETFKQHSEWQMHDTRLRISYHIYTTFMLNVFHAYYQDNLPNNPNDVIMSAFHQ